VRWHGLVFNTSGFADEGRDFILGLDAVGVRVTVVPLPSSDSRWALPRADVTRLEQLTRTPAGGPADPLISVFHATPPLCWRIPGADAHVARSMFETDRIPDGWPRACESMDEIWVPSAFNLETFARSGVPRTKLVRVPEAIDAQRFSRPTRPLAIPRVRQFNFLSVFEWSLRKGWDVLLRAFLEEFTRDEDVALIIRASPGTGRTIDDLWHEARALMRRHGLGRDWPPHVILHPTLLRAEQLPALYKAADAFVLPTRGEAWGRPFMEAMLMQLPVIATRGGGHMDFLNDENSYLVDCRSTGVPARALRDFPFPRPHRWAEPSRAHLRRLMREVFEDRPGARQKAHAARETIVASYGRQHVAQEIKRHLERIVDTRPPARRNHRPAPGRLTIVWQGPLLARHSLARVNRELAWQLMQTGCELVLRSSEPNPFDPDADAGFGRIAGCMFAVPSRRVDVHVRHAWPPNLIAPGEGRWVVMQPWEFGSLPRMWLRALSREVDEVWVPSHHVRQGYVEAGLRPERVVVIPNGVDARQFHPAAEPLDLGRPPEFRFLFVGGTVYRKGIDLLLQAYRMAFEKRDPVCLVIKDFGVDSFYKGQTDGRHIRALQRRGDGPAIVYLDATLPERELVGLYRTCDVLVHPYRGEGFGLPILESMACGVPAIVTNGGACLDFCNEQNSRMVRAGKRYLPRGLLGPFETVHRPWVYEVDVRHLAETLRHAYEHPAEMRALGMKASKDARAQWTWERSARKVLDRIDVLRETPVIRLRAGRAAPGA
jgi:glycosyltransferase involved in cell wall biosynthesis